MNKYLSLLSKYRQSIMGFAILWIMLFHLDIRFDNLFFNLVKKSGYAGVDIFLFLSGFGLYFSLSKKNFNLKHYYHNRFVRIMPEFWLLLCVIFIIRHDFSATSFYHLLCSATTLGYWFNGPYKLWFISCIMVFYAIFPLYYRMFEKYGIKIPIIAIAIGLTLIILYVIISICFFDNKHFDGLLILSIARIPIFFVGSIFGYWAISGCKFEISKLFITIYILSIFSLAIIFQPLSNYLPFRTLNYLLLIMVTPLLCILLSYFFNKVKFANILFHPFGTISLELYLCHEHIYHLSPFLKEYMYDKYVYILLILLSILTAYLLFYINKVILKKILDKTLQCERNHTCRW